MKKKYYTGIMAIAVSMTITAYGGGSQSLQNEVTELSAELEKELSADDKAAIKEAQAELKIESKENITNESSDLNEVGVKLSDVDPCNTKIIVLWIF